jgi:hypothetical protein
LHRPPVPITSFSAGGIHHFIQSGKKDHADFNSSFNLRRFHGFSLIYGAVEIRNIPEIISGYREASLRRNILLP